jgi:hypothetical protein
MNNWLSAQFIFPLFVNFLMAVHFFFRLRRKRAQKFTGLLIILSSVPAIWILAHTLLAEVNAIAIISTSLWILFSLLDLVLDYILKLDFRQGNPVLLIIFLVLYYGSTVTLWASSYDAGLAPYLIVTIAFLCQAVLSILIRITEKKESEKDVNQL